jgi:hypothetical protein
VFGFAGAEASGQDMSAEPGPFEVSEPASLIACSTRSTIAGKPRQNGRPSRLFATPTPKR